MADGSTVRDGNITKDAMYGAVAPDDFEAMLQLDRVMGLPELIEDAIAFKYVSQPLSAAQTAELLQTPKGP